MKKKKCLRCCTGLDCCSNISCCPKISSCWCSCKTTSSCWCSFKTNKKSTKKQLEAVDQHKNPRIQTNAPIIERLASERKTDSSIASSKLPPGPPNPERFLPDPARTVPERSHSGSAKVSPDRLPPGPARELPIPNCVIGQEVFLKTALSYLTDDAVGIVGIYGPGGVGKTTLLKRVNNQFCGSAGRSEFDHVVFVVVGKNPDLFLLQKNIANEVGLLLREDENEDMRAAAIFKFLKEKNFLLLLDDLWSSIELAKVGIPHPNSDSEARCKQKVILSTRGDDISGKMQAHKILILECLKWEEAWNLFKMKIGEDIAEDKRIRGLAMVLARECSGLPLALSTLGSAMSTKKTPEEWQNATALLKSLRLHEISGCDNDLLPLLHVSYENLQDHRIRECFLSYSLWPEGYQVLKENVIKSWMGLGTIGESGDIKEAYDIGYSIVESLKATSLLESDEPGSKRLEMHDIVREVALWIATEQGSNKNRWLLQAKNGQSRAEDWNRAERISLMYGQIEELPDSCVCPNLECLILRGNKRLFKVPNGLFSCMPALKLLDLSHTGIDTLPAEVGKLVNLQFLNLSYTKITCLPEEMQELTNLKYLELEGTSELKRIPHGMLASLEALQVFNLYMSGFANWNWLSIRGHSGVTFEELVSLSRLRSVGFTVKNIPSLLRLFSMRRIMVHSLTIRELRGLISLHLLPALLSRNKMGNLRNLTIESSQGLKELVLGDVATDGPNWSLFKLEVFNLVCLPELERVIWRGVKPYACLPNLRFLSLFYCNNLKSISWTLHLPLLEELYVQNCTNMEHVVGEDPSRASRTSVVIEERGMACFPNLKYVFLRDLAKLVNIYDQTLVFPSLERILVYNCMELKRLPFGVRSAEKMRMIFGEKFWWENLNWMDHSIKYVFLPCFREIPYGWEPSMKALNGL